VQTPPVKSETDAKVTGSLAQTLQGPALIALYEELAVEDVALAEEGMTDYWHGLERVDRA